MQKNFIPVSIIKKKRDGEVLSKEEIRFFIEGFTSGEIPEYQMSAFLMAVYFRSMSAEETANLVEIMEHSGATVDLSSIKKPKFDKHSTGGIGDKPTLVLAPLLASCGVVFPTIAGRGLGHTGGTLDKLESIPGFNVFLPLERFKELTASTGLCFMGQTEEICPADKKIYALRDVTATIESTPLIVASIMSKKLAEGIDGLVFDVKYGSGAFMKTPKDAENLAHALVDTAKQAGKLASAIISDMSQPLGRAVGNSIEVNECVAFLRQGPQDAPVDERLYELTLALAVDIFVLAEKQKGGKINPSAARELLEDALKSGAAYSKFLEIVSLQGGDTVAVDQGLPLASKKIDFVATKKGFISSMNAEMIGMALIELGGGRKKSSDTIDPSVGFYFEKFIGDAVKKDETIATLYSRDAKSADKAIALLMGAITITNESTQKPKLIHSRI